MTFIYGILGGIIITMLIIIVFNYVKTNPKLANKKLHTTTKSLANNAKNNKKSKLTSQNPINNYDFYNLLPNGQTSNTTNTTTNSTINNSTINNKMTNSNKNQYILQIGSFRQIDEADELKAKLALHGFEANIETVIDTTKKDTNYKVTLGPFFSKPNAITKKEQLDLAGFKNTLIKNI